MTAGECAVALHSALLGAPETRLSPGAFMATAFAATAQAAVPSVNPIAATGVAPTTRSSEGPSVVATTADSIALGRTKAPETKSSRPTIIGLAIVGVLAVGGGATILAMRSGPSIAAEAPPSPAGQAASAAAAQPPLPAPPAATPPPPAPTATVAPTLSAAPVATAAATPDPKPATPAAAERARVAATKTKQSTAKAGPQEPAPKPPVPAQSAPGKTEVYGER